MEKTTLLLQLTRAEKTQIEVFAKKEGKTVSEYMRLKALNK